MKKEEEIQANYLRKRREIEELEDAIYYFKRKGEEVAQRTFDEITSQMQREEDFDIEIRDRACKELAYEEEAYYEKLQEKKRLLRQKEEEYEAEYRQEMLQLEINK